jgi:hypothetical protein
VKRRAGPEIYIAGIDYGRNLVIGEADSANVRCQGGVTLLSRQLLSAMVSMPPR